MSKLFLIASLALFASALFGCLAQGGERQICQVESRGDGWHYRTRIGGRLERCWYEGRAMKPRHELYWAEAPAVAPADVSTWELLERWRGEYQNPGAAPGWMHKE